MPGGWGTPTWMGGVPNIGETFVFGRTPATARALLAAADDLGLDPHVVRTTGKGFVVPDQVWTLAQDNGLIVTAGGDF